MFGKALPIWLDGKEKDMNIQARYVSEFLCNGECVIKITGSTYYRVYLNDKLIHYGPAPAAHGYARVDVIYADNCNGNNRLVIEAAGYNCYAYACVKQTSFIQAEVFCNEQCMCATGFDFHGYLVPSRIQKVMRYSFQRHFTEVWDHNRKDIPYKVSVQSLNLKYLPRRSHLPSMEKDDFRSAYSKGRFNIVSKDWDIPSMQGATDRISEVINGFELGEIETFPIQTLSSLEYNIVKREESLPISLGFGEYVVFECKNNTCAMMNFEYCASDCCRFIVAFDEKLIDGRFDYEHWNNMNVIEIRSSGKNTFTNFEPYGYKYFSVFVLEGSLCIKKSSIIKIINPLPNPPKLNTSDEDLQKIYCSAVESARCNSLGIFMDCPSRERAGWLCDSWFSAKADWLLSGNTYLEDDFVENYLLANCKELPDGMLPMCYPSDHPNGNYIPQWSLWFIAQLDEYIKRNTSVDVFDFRDVAYGLVNYFEPYENEYGLLENVDGWNFVEWTKASDWTDGVHFPTNMLYSFVLNIIGNWFEDKKLIEKAVYIKNYIVTLSYDGLFFHDHALRNSENKLECTTDISEICQYYAVMFDVANKDCFKSLYDVLVHKFGTSGLYNSDIERVNVFTGMYMRMELLRRWKQYDVLVNDIKNFFGNMSDITGTLWETKELTNSLNHGFTAYLTVILLEIFNGINLDI